MYIVHVHFSHISKIMLNVLYFIFEYFFLHQLYHNIEHQIVVMITCNAYSYSV